MRVQGLRVLSFGLFVALTAAAVLLLPAPNGLAQVPLAGMKGESGEQKELVTEKIAFPESKETKRQLEAVGEYLAQKDVKWDLVCRLVQGMLDAKSDYFYQFEDGEKRRVSVKDEVNRIMNQFPAEGKGFYQNVYGPTADTMLKGAKEAGFDKSRLAEVAQRFYFTKAGAEAAVLLATINLESGNYSEAAYGYRRLIGRSDAEAVLTPKNLFRAAVALRRANAGKQTDEIAAVWDKLEKKFPRDGLAYGRKAFTLDQLKAELERPVELLYSAVGSQYVAMKGGDATRGSLAEAGIPFLGPILSVPVLYNTGTKDQKEATEKVNAWITSAYKDKRFKSPLLPGFFPVTAPNMLIYRGYDGVYAFYTRNCVDGSGLKRSEGEQAWFCPCEYGAATIENPSLKQADGTSVDSQNQQQWLDRWRGDATNPHPGILFENPLTGSLSHDGKRAYFVDDYNIPPPGSNYNPEMGGVPPPAARGSKSEHNRLIAVDLETGLVQWILGGSALDVSNDGDNVTTSDELGRGTFFLGPPVSLNGKLYVLLEREGSMKLACLDSYRTSPVENDPKAKPTPWKKQPELVWLQNLGRATTGLKQDTEARRIQGVFLASAEGVMVCPTNTGAYVGIDLNARSLLWAHTYGAGTEKTDSSGRPGGAVRFGTRPVNQPVGLLGSRWRSSNPIIVGNRVVVTSFDSALIECLELRTGKLLWKESRRPSDLYVGGVVGGNVLIVGQAEMRAIKLVGDPGNKTPEKTTSAWESNPKYNTVLGHGVAGRDGAYYLPVIGEPDRALDSNSLPSVVAIDAATGKYVGTPTLYRRKEGTAFNVDSRLTLGNLVFHDNMMFSQSATEIVGFPLNEAKQKEVAALLANNPNDPDGLLSRGELVLETGKVQQAIADFKAAEANKPSEPTQKKLKQKLYVAYTELLRTQFDAAEPVLAEYRTLCEFPVNANDIDSGRQLDEQTRRRGLMYSLIAKGREKQGRLLEAFDNYRSYAELGDTKKLMPVPEDTNTMALSSVWASERINAMMMAAKEPAIRAPVVARLTADLAAIKSTNDLGKLRTFVKTFGSNFEQGREAQYLFAERLNSTNDDANRREAQDLLLALLSQAEDEKDAPGAARATESLARLLTSRGMTDDAMGLYSGLSQKYPREVIRDGKTGNDLLGELITDKRYLPSLESGSVNRLGAYNVAIASGGGSSMPGPSMNLVPERDAFPFYRRNLVTLEGDFNNGTPFVMVRDRVTRQVKTRSAPILAMNVYAYNTGVTDPNSGMNNQKIAQTSGHLMLVQVYHKVVCFDLSKDISKQGQGRLWEVNLLGANSSSPQNGQNWQYMFTTDKSGEVVAKPIYYDNLTGQQRTEHPFRIGRNMILQPTYATVMTKDAIVTRDPRTGQVLWMRQPPAIESMIFGDTKYVYLVETDSKGFTSKVLRAVDGVEVPDVPNFGKFVRDNAGRLHLDGRRVLLSDTGVEDDKKVRILRLYDILAGKDIWRKAFPGDAVALDTIDPKLTGVVESTGMVTVLNSATGDLLATLAPDATKAKEQLFEKEKFAVVKPLLLADDDRYFVFYNRALPQPLLENIINGNSPIRARAVNGCLYAWERSTGKMLGHNNGEFYNMRLIVERFEELPCLIAVNPMYIGDENSPVGRGQAGTGHKLVVFDKANASLRGSKTLFGNPQWMNNFFQVDSGGFELNNGNQSLKISPEAAGVKK